MDELRKALKETTITFGTESTLKRLRNGKAKKVFMASNCPESTKKRIEYYTKIAKVELVKLDIPSDEIGLICKKPFSISVLSY
ncbi:MAG: ribosomal L7Ae/L30e/S12e/Gadd45 family protein [Candidatus Nanoarchaeia archaeon]